MAPGLRMKKGRAGDDTHGCKLDGTTTLFAPLNVLDRHVLEASNGPIHPEFVKALVEPAAAGLLGTA